MAFMPFSLADLEKLGGAPTADLAAVTDLCDPLRPLAFDVQDELRTNLDAVRGGEVLAPIARQIERAQTSRRVHLVSGLTGCGKSTEILRLQARLAGEGRSRSSRRFRTLYIDMLEYMSIKDLDFSWVMLGVLAVLVSEFKGLARISGPLKHAWADLRQVLDHADIGVDAKIDVGLVKLGLQLKSDAHSRDKLRLRLPPLAEQLIDRTNEFVAELREQLSTGDDPFDDLVLILDNLEKMIPAPVEGTARDSFETTFYDGAPLFQRLDLHLVMTVPAALCYRDVRAATLPLLYSTTPRIIPMVRVTGRQGGPHAPGITALRDLLGRRLDLDVMFGGDDLLVEDLCQLCGGSVRRLMNIVAEMSLAVDEPPMTRVHLEQVVTKLAGTVDRGLPREYLPPLAEVASTHDFPSSIVEGNRVKGECLQSLLAMEYNGEGHWYDVDPMLRKLPRFLVALEAFTLRADESADPPDDEVDG